MQFLLVSTLITTFSIGCCLHQLRDQSSDFFLPGNIKPIHYNIKVITHIDKFNMSDESTFKFDGVVEIILKPVEQDVKTIILFGKRMVIQHSELRKMSNALAIPLRNNTPKPDFYDKLHFDLKSGHLQGDEMYSLTILYTGDNHSDLRGFFRVSYTDSVGSSRWLLATHFESVHARRAFPCFDEPKYKTTFTVSVSVPKTLTNHTALSNSPLLGHVLTDPNTRGNKLFQFKKSPVPIPTYLVAFIVSDLHCSTSIKFQSKYLVSDRTKQFRTWGKATYIDNSFANVSQLIGPKVLETASKLLGIGYAFEKLDQVGVPEFVAGAMENIGLVFYRERTLFVHSKNDSLSTVQDTCLTIAHELLHQWFGNLVTLHSWSDIWLNEGLTSFFQYYVTSKITNTSLDIESWDLPHLFVVDEMQHKALITDSKPFVRPLTSEVFAFYEIDSSFDEIAYAKGASVVRMFQHVLGEDIFMEAIRIYLRRRQKKNVTPEDLTNAFQESIDQSKRKPNLGGKSVRHLFENWRTMPGYPVVKVTRHKRNVLYLSQKRFYSIHGYDVDPKHKWFVPINYVTDNHLVFTTGTQYWLTPTSNLSLTIQPDVQWYIFNNQQTGYYRVNYDEDNWRKLIEVLHDKTFFRRIHPINRAQLIDDSFKLAFATSENFLPTSIPLELIKYISHEVDPGPIKAASYQVRYMRTRLIMHPQLKEKFKDYVKSVLHKRYRSLPFHGSSNERPNNRLLREMVVSLACSLGIKDCIDKANILFDAAFRGHNQTRIHFKINPDIRRAVYCSAVRNGGFNKWNMLWRRYKQLEESVEKDDIISALGCSTNINILNELLEKTLYEYSGLAAKDRVGVMTAVYEGNPENIQVITTFLNKNIHFIINMYNQDQFRDFLLEISNVLDTQTGLNIMKKIVKSTKKRFSKGHEQLLESATVAVSNIEGNRDWQKTKLPHIEKWLDNNLYRL